MKIPFLLTLLTLAATLTTQAAEGWKPLFNGKDIKDWQINTFGGAGEVKVEDGKIIIGNSPDLAGYRQFPLASSPP